MQNVCFRFLLLLVDRPEQGRSKKQQEIKRSQDHDLPNSHLCILHACVGTVFLPFISDTKSLILQFNPILNILLKKTLYIS